MSNYTKIRLSFVLCGGSGSDIEARMKDLDLDIQEGSSSIIEKEDDVTTVQHMYFAEDTVTEKEQEGSSVCVDIPDDISEATTSAPVCKHLPSGHIAQVSKQPIPIGDGTESLFSRFSKYDKKDTNFGENQFLGVLFHPRNQNQIPKDNRENSYLKL